MIEIVRSNCDMLAYSRHICQKDKFHLWWNETMVKSKGTLSSHNLLHKNKIIGENKMKKKIWIECNHDGPIMFGSNKEDALYIGLDDIERELGIIDTLEHGGCFPVWIDTKDYTLKNKENFK